MSAPPRLATALRTAGLALLAACAAPAAPTADPAVLSLAGRWRFQLDRTDAGRAERWFTRTLPGTIQLPGTLPLQGIGDPVTLETKWTGGIVDRSWLDAPAYAPYRQPGHVKVPFWLQPETTYAGPAWYQREFTVPPPGRTNPRAHPRTPPLGDARLARRPPRRHRRRPRHAPAARPSRPPLLQHLLEHRVDPRPAPDHARPSLRPAPPGPRRFPDGLPQQLAMVVSREPRPPPLRLDGLPAATRPIGQVIDDWFTARKLGLVFAARAGRGRLVVCSIDLTDAAGDNPVARQLRTSLLRSMAGNRFAPSVDVSIASLAQLMTP